MVQGEDCVCVVLVGQYDVGCICDFDLLILVFCDDVGGLFDFGGIVVGEFLGFVGEFMQDGEFGIDIYLGGDEIVEFCYYIRGYDECVCGVIDVFRYCGVVWFGGVEIGKQCICVDDYCLLKLVSSLLICCVMGFEFVYRFLCGGGLVLLIVVWMDFWIICVLEILCC